MEGVEEPEPTLKGKISNIINTKRDWPTLSFRLQLVNAILITLLQVMAITSKYVFLNNTAAAIRKIVACDIFSSLCFVLIPVWTVFVLTAKSITERNSVQVIGTVLVNVVACVYVLIQLSETFALKSCFGDFRTTFGDSAFNKPFESNMTNSTVLDVLLNHPEMDPRIKVVTAFSVRCSALSNQLGLRQFLNGPQRNNSVTGLDEVIQSWHLSASGMKEHMWLYNLSISSIFVCVIATFALCILGSIVSFKLFRQFQWTIFDVHGATKRKRDIMVRYFMFCGLIHLCYVLSIMIVDFYTFAVVWAEIMNLRSTNDSVFWSVISGSIILGDILLSIDYFIGSYGIRNARYFSSILFLVIKIILPIAFVPLTIRYVINMEFAVSPATNGFVIGLTCLLVLVDILVLFYTVMCMLNFRHGLKDMILLYNAPTKTSNWLLPMMKRDETKIVLTQPAERMIID